MNLPGPGDVQAARRRIAPWAHRTPVATSRWMNQQTGVACYFKCENLQRVGAFKFRGSCNAVFSLSDAEAARGVTTHSSGNHAQALALAAQLRGAAATIVMPSNAPRIKQAAVAGYGARIVLCEPTLAAREAAAAAVLAETGGTLVHPYNDPLVIAGQGTATWELLEQSPPLDAVLTPVGGGGLLSGAVLAVQSWRTRPDDGLAAESFEMAADGENPPLAPSIAVLGAEPAGAADARRSLHSGERIPSTSPRTVADGLLTSLGDRTFALIRRGVAEIVAVEEDEIVAAMRHVWERLKLVIEPSAAVPVAALLFHAQEVQAAIVQDRRAKSDAKAGPDGGTSDRPLRIGVILSGGNLDLDRLPWQR